MHPRNKYNRPPDFNELATLYPDFALFYRSHSTTSDNNDNTSYTKPTSAALLLAATSSSTSSTSTSQSTPFPTKSNKRKRIDFKDPAALKCLTKTLLLHDFNIRWDMPLNHLCPALTVRLNYLHWIEDLLNLANITKENVRGLDIGTGASVIYPLLGCRLHNTWSFVATEVDQESIQYAQKNIEQNNMKDRIKLVHVADPSVTQILQPIQHDMFSFTMCNPPFFETNKVLPSDTATGKSATVSETVTSGGEVTFVLRMIEESCMNPTQSTWFTSMLGMKSSLKPIQAKLYDVGAKSIETTRLVQGKTSRWTIAWSFFKMIRPSKSKKQHRTFVAQDVNIDTVIARVKECLETNEHIDSFTTSCTATTTTTTTAATAATATTAATAATAATTTKETKGSSGSKMNITLKVIAKNNDAYQIKVTTAIIDDGDTVENVSIQVEGDTNDHSHFDRLVQKLQKDITRTGRSWRRKLKVKKKIS